jgi:hypothetical protein
VTSGRRGRCQPVVRRERAGIIETGPALQFRDPCRARVPRPVSDGRQFQNTPLLHGAGDEHGRYARGSGNALEPGEVGGGYRFGIKRGTSRLTRRNGVCGL